MNLCLPEGVRPTANDSCKINLQHLEHDNVGGSLVSLGVRQTGENEFVAPLVSAGGLTKVEYLASQIVSERSNVDKALDIAELILKKAKERREGVG